MDPGLLQSALRVACRVLCRTVRATDVLIEPAFMQLS